ncbi:MAG: arylesterase [Lautropia sp.]|nr:arylesterase [Lautropia sp.]
MVTVCRSLVAGSRRTFLSVGMAAALLGAALSLPWPGTPGMARADQGTRAGVAGGDAPSARPVMLIVGDSLSAEYGLARGEGWVALLERRLRDDDPDLKRPDWQVVNASISGETTSGGRSRLPQLLKQHRPALTVIELGGNDALRGLSIRTAQGNLRQMIDEAKSAGSKVLLIGMQVPPNYGAAYARQFRQMYERLADETGSALVPFLLAGFETDRASFQPDGIHPSAAAQPGMLDNVWPVLKGLLEGP